MKSTLCSKLFYSLSQCYKTIGRLYINKASLNKIQRKHGLARECNDRSWVQWNFSKELTDPQPHLQIRDLNQVEVCLSKFHALCVLLVEFERGRQSIGNGGCWVKPQWVVGIDFGAVEDLDCRAFLASACRGSCNRRISIRCYQLPPISLPPPEWPSTSS